MQSSISNNKSKARGLVPRRHLRHLSTISRRSEESSRGDRDHIRVRKFTVSEKMEAITDRERLDFWLLPDTIDISSQRRWSARLL